jgi:bifunctional DNA-binding transcriptional regulator/antitoxin component of YhaV-PrlF toxin-antitoxin module
MTYALKVNARNDLHIPAEILRRLNLGADRIVRAEIRGSTLVLVAVDIEPRYSHEELEGLQNLHEDEKKKGLISLKTEKDIDRLVK